MAVLKQIVEPKKLAGLESVLVGGVAPEAMPRLQAAVLSARNIQAELSFTNDERYRIHVQGKLVAEVQRECQRCLEPVWVALEAQVNLMVVKAESQIAELPAEVDAWLVLGDSADLYEVLEEELLLAMPYVSYHAEQCVDLARVGAGDPADDEGTVTTDSPFKVLEQLKSPDTTPR